MNIEGINIEINPQLFIRLAMGLGLLAFGWTLFRFGVNAVGFCVGYMFGSTAYPMVLQLVAQLEPDWLRFFPQHELAPYVAGAIFGVMGIFFARSVYRLTIFVGVLSGSLYLMYATPQRDYVNQIFEWFGVLEKLNETMGDAWPAALCLIVSALVLLSQKVIIIVLTSCMGAFVLAESINVPVLFLPLCIIGFFLQKTQKRTPKKVKKAEEDEE